MFLNKLVNISINLKKNFIVKLKNSLVIKIYNILIIIINTNFSNFVAICKDKGLF